MITPFAAFDVLSFDDACLVKRALPIAFLIGFWVWETWRPYFGRFEEEGGRLRHAARNVTLALANTAILALAFGGATAWVAAKTSAAEWGLLAWLRWSVAAEFALALVLLDLWMYGWHRANHRLPLLWRFHRMHHSDRAMDVTTATRFHLGEHVGANTARLALIPLLGLDLWQLVVYDALVIAITQFHHADIGLGRWDRWLRLAIVTPEMHKVHHSDWRPETDSNYSTVLSCWDRLAGTFRVRSDWQTFRFGLARLAGPSWRTWSGMWSTPFRDQPDPPPDTEEKARPDS